MIPESVHDNFKNALEQIGKNVGTYWTEDPGELKTHAWHTDSTWAPDQAMEEIGRPQSPQEKRRAHVKRIRANHKKGDN